MKRTHHSVSSLNHLSLDWQTTLSIRWCLVLIFFFHLSSCELTKFWQVQWVYGWWNGWFSQENSFLLFSFYFNFRNAKINWNLKKQKYTRIDSAQRLLFRSFVRSEFLYAVQSTHLYSLYVYIYWWQKVVFAADSLGNKSWASWNLYSIDDCSVEFFSETKPFFSFFLILFFFLCDCVRPLFLLHLVKIHENWFWKCWAEGRSQHLSLHFSFFRLWIRGWMSERGKGW